MLLLTLVNVPLSVEPSVVTAPMMTTAMRPAIRAYSRAVTARSSCFRRSQGLGKLDHLDVFLHEAVRRKPETERAEPRHNLTINSSLSSSKKYLATETIECIAGPIKENAANVYFFVSECDF